MIISTSLKVIVCATLNCSEDRSAAQGPLRLAGVGRLLPSPVPRLSRYARRPSPALSVASSADLETPRPAPLQASPPAGLPAGLRHSSSTVANNFAIYDGPREDKIHTKRVMPCSTSIPPCRPRSCRQKKTAGRPSPSAEPPRASARAAAAGAGAGGGRRRGRLGGRRGENWP